MHSIEMIHKYRGLCGKPNGGKPGQHCMSCRAGVLNNVNARLAPGLVLCRLPGVNKIDVFEMRFDPAPLGGSECGDVYIQLSEERGTGLWAP